MEKTSMDKTSRTAEVASMANLQSFLVERRSWPDQVGPRITALREALGLAKHELADSIGLDRSTLTKIEQGKVGLDIAKGEIIATRYGFGLDYIYRGELSDAPPRHHDAILRSLSGQESQ
jgi:transcriptional regulator with XRE-family HTH domain